MSLNQQMLTTVSGDEQGGSGQLLATAGPPTHQHVNLFSVCVSVKDTSQGTIDAPFTRSLQPAASDPGLQEAPLTGVLSPGGRARLLRLCNTALTPALCLGAI